MLWENKCLLRGKMTVETQWLPELGGRLCALYENDLAQCETVAVVSWCISCITPWLHHHPAWLLSDLIFPTCCRTL